MAPIRRYLRISKYSVLECRIYLENPSDVRWLLDRRDPVIARVFAAIRPLVLPKLREENARAMAKKKDKPVKDVIVEDEFEVAIFLRESRTRHSLLTKQKAFEGAGDTSQKKAAQTGSNASANAPARILVESDSGSEFDLYNVPEASRDIGSDIPSKRRREPEQLGGSQEDTHTSKRKNLETAADEDKKLDFHTNYESFNTCGSVLCLLVTRRGEKVVSKTATSEPPRQALMEEWMSTQAEANPDEV